MTKTTRPARAPWRVLLLLLLLGAAAAPLAAGEAIYLQSGEEYRGTITRIAEGILHADVGGEARAFPLDRIQRIEFQRRRLMDEVQRAAELPALPFFQRALEPSTDELRQRFPHAGYVVLEDRTVITLGEAGAYEIKRFRAWRVLQQRGVRSARRSLTYFPDRQEVEILFGLTVTPEGEVLHLADAATQDEALYARLPDYNYQHRLRFTLKGAAPGVTFLLGTRRLARATPLEPLAVDRAFWGSEPALRLSIRLAARAEDKARVTTATANGLDAAEHDYWEVSDTPQVFPEPLMPPRESFAPRLVLAYPQASWPEIAGAFLDRAGGEPALPHRHQDARALFHFVRQDIRVEDVPLSALPDGPAPPRRTLRRGTGNEAERALLLAALLRGIGWQAHTVLVRGRSSGPLLASVPRCEGLDHAVVHTVGPDGQEHWLQADDEDRGFGELDGEVQGADGLDLHTGQVVRVPVRRPRDESVSRTVQVALQPDGTARVDDAYVLRGEPAKAHRALKDLTEAELRRWAARFVGSDITGVDLLDFQHTDFSQANAAERLSYRYTVPALAERAGRFLLLRLPNAEVSASDVGRSTREHALFWDDGPERREATFLIRPPQGYRVYALPEGLDARGSGWHARAAFEPDPQEPHAVRFADLWERSALGAPKDAYPAYRQARIHRSRLRNEVIVFVRE